MTWYDIPLLGIPALARYLTRRWDERKIHAWLIENTSDRPAKTHKTTTEISIGVRLPKERVEDACIRSKRILTHADNEGEWSAREPRKESVYEDPDHRILLG